MSVMVQVRQSDRRWILTGIDYSSSLWLPYLSYFLSTSLIKSQSKFNLQTNYSSTPSSFSTIFTPPLLHSFTPATSLEIDNLLSQSSDSYSYVSKILEKVFHTRMVAHWNATNSMPRTQSAYRQFHSTETALLKVFSNIATTTDSGRVTALCLLDLSAAFDTVDHEILLARLEKTYGFIGLTIKWLRTYIKNCAFHVQLNGELSSSQIGGQNGAEGPTTQVINV